MAKNPLGAAKNIRHYAQMRTGRIHDPYANDKGFSEPTICPVCNAVYHKKRWSFNDKLLAESKKDKNVRYHKCPADRKIEDNYAMGKVSLTGGFIDEHMDELIHVIKSEERRAVENNPMDRLMKIEKKNSGIYVETTSDTLAMRIGHHLKESYKGGDEEFKFRSGDKFVEVLWHRDM